MIVTIPILTEHAGDVRALRTFEIRDVCPICGQQRGEPFGTYHFDGSRRLHCDGWTNPCGHIDKYSVVCKEGIPLTICKEGKTIPVFVEPRPIESF